MSLIRFVVVTSVLNDFEGLALTGKSLNSLSLAPDWIIVDGGSDNDCLKSTEVLLSSYAGNSTFVRGPDTGIYDAWNKAVDVLDNNSFVIFLGAGDVLIPNAWDDCVNLVLAIHEKYKCFCFGVYLAKKSKIQTWLPRSSLKGYEWGRPYLPPHQGVLVHSTVLKHFKFDESYRVAADSKFLLQAFAMSNPLACNIILSKMDGNGISNEAKRQFKTQREIDRLVTELGLRIPVFHKIKAWSNRVLNYLWRTFTS